MNSLIVLERITRIRRIKKILEEMNEKKFKKRKQSIGEGETVAKENTAITLIYLFLLTLFR